MLGLSRAIKECFKMVIGICGGSGSGKTTLLRRISREYQELKPSLFSMDNYYRPITEQHVDEKGKVNFDLPSSLKRERLISDIKSLIQGEPIEVTEYQFNAPPEKRVLITVEPSELIIVEGLFLFEYEELQEFLDFTIFMEVDEKVQLDRRLYRDVETRGYSREDILYQWENHVVPCFNEFLLPYKPTASFCFKNNSEFDLEFARLKGDMEKKFSLLNA